MTGNRPRSRAFTLTVAIPAESGPLHGWQIESVEVPGRYADGVQKNELHIHPINN
jgi:hypothetical protein